jgi:hypothetical protein
MKHHSALLFILFIFNITEVKALSEEERAGLAVDRAQQVAEVQVHRAAAVQIFNVLDGTPTDSETATKQANNIVLRPSGLSACSRVTQFEYTITGRGTPSLKVEAINRTPDNAKVLIALLASLGIHTSIGDPRSIDPDELRTLIPGIDLDAAKRADTPIDTIWDWAVVETLSLLETSPRVFTPESPAAVKRLLEEDRDHAIRYLIKKRYKRTQGDAEHWTNQLIPSFGLHETCPRKGAFFSSVFFVFLLDNRDRHERHRFIEDVIDTMLPPPDTDYMRVFGGLKNFDLNYYILKELYRNVVAHRP